DSLKNNTVHEIENEFVYPNGSKGWFELKIQPVPEGVFILSQDITERKKIEETLKQNKAVLEAAGEMAQIGGWELDTKTMEVTWTEETYRIHEVPLGIKPPLEEAINFYHPDDKETLTKAIQRAFDAGEPYDMELRFITAKGKHIWVRTICRPLIKNGKTVKLSGSFQNITNRKKIEESLKEKEQFLNTLLNAIPVPVFYKDKNGRYLGFNKAFIAFTGIEREKLVGKSVFDVHPPDLAKIYHSQDKKLLEKGGSQRYESELVDVNGDRLNVIFNKATFTDEKGEVNGLIGTILDITRLKNIENELIKKNKELESAKEHLEKSEKRLKEAHVLAKLGDWEFDFGTNHLWWSDETCRIFEIDPEEFTGSMDEFLNFIHPDDREREIKAYQDHIATQRPYEISHRIVLANGRVKHIHQKCQTAFDKNGNAVKSIGTIQDFTEIKQIEHKLLKLNEELEERVEERTSEIRKLSEAVKYSPSIVFITNPQGVIEYVNPKFTELTGYTVGEAVGKTPRILNSGTHSKAFFANLWQTIKSGKVWRNEVCNKKKSGELYWEDVSISSIKNKKNEITHFVSVREDITQRKAMEQELKLAKEEAEKANQAKSEFLANMSHEIRTPMNAVLGFADLLSQMVKDELQKSYLDSIKSSGKSLLTLINDILDLSKIEAGKLELELNYVDLNDLFREMKTIFSLSGMNKGIEYAVNVASNVPPLVLIDEIRLRQVLINLLSNAFKFTPKGYINLTANAINIESQKEFCDLYIEVEDSGIGISEESQAKIFDAFSQQEGQSAKKYGGTGLGLTISKRLISLMNGKIELKSEVDKGTTFRLGFEKIKFTANKLMEKEHASVNIENIQFKKSEVLIVDDIEDNRKYLAGVLTNLNIRVIQAVDGQEALEKLNGKKVDLIITDLVMPNIDGFQLKKHLSLDDH
ncbi:MAG: PAS domain S-box protein, partial [Chloroflexia bacterium]|nr:PAS domain S-box protein [Chloroflexia bacterium]